MPRFTECIWALEIQPVHMTRRFLTSVCFHNLKDHRNAKLNLIVTFQSWWVSLKFTSWLWTSFSDSRKGKEWFSRVSFRAGVTAGKSSPATYFIRATLRTRASRTRRPKSRRPKSHGPPKVYTNSSKAVWQFGMWYLSDMHLYGQGVSATPPFEKEIGIQSSKTHAINF